MRTCNNNPKTHNIKSGGSQLSISILYKLLLKQHHNKRFLVPRGAELLLCAGGSHLVFRVGAEGSRPFWPGYVATTFLCNTLSFTDVIHVQIIFGPIVHPPRFQILAETSDKMYRQSWRYAPVGKKWELKTKKQTPPLVSSSCISF